MADDSASMRFSRFQSWLLCSFVMVLLPAAGWGVDHTHSGFTPVLDARVNDRGEVDYAGLKADPQALQNYLRDLAHVDAESYRLWTRDQQLAYLINLYNAQTLDLVIRHYPIRSIKDIGSLWTGPWGQPVVHLFGRPTTLDFLQHQVIRPVFHNPAVHFALVSAARSSPPLRREPYRADHLAAQLADQTRIFFASGQRNFIEIESGVLHLSELFRWYGEGFAGKDGTLLDGIRGMLPASWRDALDARPFRLNYVPFDWSLNEGSPQQGVRAP